LARRSFLLPQNTAPAQTPLNSSVMCLKRSIDTVVDDRDSGSPQKLKNVDIAKIEKVFAEVVEKLVAAKSGEIASEITAIDFRPHGSNGVLNGTTKITIEFSKRIDTEELFGTSDK
jgi:hypothetical protein